jgi:hypothetical protein
VPHPPQKHFGSRRNGPPAGRRKPPPDATGEERRYLAGCVKTGSRLAVELLDGSRSLGIVRSFNEDTIEIQADDRPLMLLRKSQIRSIEELD